MSCDTITMKFSLFVIIILNLLNYVIVIQTQSLVKYELIIDYLDLPESRQDKLINFGTVRVKKLNRTTYGIHGYFEILLNLTEDIGLTYEIYTLQGNEYRRTTEKSVNDICRKSQLYKPYFIQYLNYTDISPEYECPFPSGRYNFYNAAFSNLIIPFAPIRGEKHRLNVTYSLGGEILSKHSIYYLLKRQIPSALG